MEQGMEEITPTPPEKEVEDKKEETQMKTLNVN